MSAVTKSKPILFSTDIVQAILQGRKTQTRRVVKPQSVDKLYHVQGKVWGEGFSNTECEKLTTPLVKCPYGQVGDRLWVRETWAGNKIDGYEYKADYSSGVCIPWKPSIHMPREACRIELEIVGIRVENLLAISWQDEQAEGFEKPSAFLNKWDALNEKRGFGSSTNPVVWVIEFKVVKGQADE